MDMIIKNGYLVEPRQGIEGKYDILVRHGMIAGVDKNIKKDASCRILDAKGLYVFPGLIDMHCHLREPGREDEETIVNGSLSAVKGGFTTICCMPNTSPPLDNKVAISFVKNRALTAYCDVLPVGAITVNREGKELASYGEMVQEGACAFSDDGDCVMDSLVMRRALEYSKLYGKRIISHSEDKFLSKNGVMHEGALSAKMGLIGIPRQSEEIMVNRDIALAELTGGLLHIAHLSTKEAVDAIRRARKNCPNITCEVTVHHLILTEEAVEGYNANAKVSPPLRTAKDLKALVDGLKDATIDCIVTDNAPHSIEEKESGFENAPFGIIGFETALPLSMGLSEKGPGIRQIISAWTDGPARVLGLKDRGSIAEGMRADLVIVDPALEWVYEEEEILSKSKNSPFVGWKLKGKVMATVCKGRVVFESKGRK
ncbi:MAG TPA: dihydroorotase [bacterium]|nr:dihydroorotase [bacterium]